MNLPRPSRSHPTYKKTILDATKTVTERSIFLTVEEAVELSGTIDLCVAVDGTRQKRIEWSCMCHKCRNGKVVDVSREISGILRDGDFKGFVKVLKFDLYGSDYKTKNKNVWITYRNGWERGSGIRKNSGKNLAGIYRLTVLSTTGRCARGGGFVQRSVLSPIEMRQHPGRNCLRAMKRREEERIRKSEKDLEEFRLRGRKRTIQKRKRLEDDLAEEEDPSGSNPAYGAGSPQ
ncbi:hypothetical protein HHI36_021622 [Cryptolaemus montrouzieri]|uniref:Uncharacterized protein n=1 Tax=Cryptolaemus montrouzieri TaxID=559131 RepID=A0ABD2MXB3_9CUCU